MKHKQKLASLAEQKMVIFEPPGSVNTMISRAIVIAALASLKSMSSTLIELLRRDLNGSRVGRARGFDGSWMRA